MARTLANIGKRHYRVLHRAPATFDQPADLSEWTTFLATFTELGYCRDKTIKQTIEPEEKEALDDGTKLLLSYKGTLEGLLLQSKPADYTAYEAIENTEQDVILVSSDVCIFLGEAVLDFGEAVVSGEVETVPFKFEKEGMANKSSFRTRFLIPTV